MRFSASSRHDESSSTDRIPRLYCVFLINTGEQKTYETTNFVHKISLLTPPSETGDNYVSLALKPKWIF